MLHLPHTPEWVVFAEGVESAGKPLGGSDAAAATVVESSMLLGCCCKSTAQFALVLWTGVGYGQGGEGAGGALARTVGCVQDTAQWDTCTLLKSNLSWSLIYLGKPK
jgi:hypothetical protein